jgi:arylsulfatase A-like enzyme
MQGRELGCGGLCWVLLSGFVTQPALQRVGPTATKRAPEQVRQAEQLPSCASGLSGRLRLGGDTRSTLPHCAVQLASAQLQDHCTLHVALANTSPEPGATLHFGIAYQRAGREFANETGLEVAPAQAWTDLSIPISTDRALRQIRFQISGKQPEHGAIAQPMLSCPAEPAPAKAPRNVLVISLDTLRADRLGAYGNTQQLTPHLDRIASQGTAFMQAYAQYPNTHGSHAALFTGQYATRLGMLGGSHARMRPDQATLASALAARGYVTVAFTEDGFVSSMYGFDHGFDRYDEGAANETTFEGYAASTFKRASEWLRQRPAAPFFMFLHTYEVHAPYAPNPAAMARVRAEQPDYRGPLGERFESLATTAYNFRTLNLSAADMRFVSALYDAEVWTLDQRIGELFDALGSMGLLDSTLIVILADHGEEFGEHGFMAHGETLQTQALHVPLIFYARGLVPEGLQVRAPAGLLDVPATLADLLGVGPILPGSAGIDRAAALRGKPQAAQLPVISELVGSATACGAPRDSGFTICEYDGVSLRDRDFAYIESRAKHSEWLFDRRADPDELHDLAAAQPAVTAKYRQLARQFRGSLKKHDATQLTAPDAAVEAQLRALGYVK